MSAKQRSPGARIAIRVAIVMGFVVLFAGLGILYPALARGPELMNAAWHRPWFLLGLLLVPFVFWRGTFGEDRRTPRLLLELTTSADRAKARRAFDAMMRMRKIDLAALEAAVAKS